MNYYLFTETSQSLDPIYNAKKVNHAASKTATQSKSLLKGKELAQQDKTSPEHSRLETKFRNDTDKDQTYSFKFDKTRTARVDVNYQRGFSFGGRANFTLGLPSGPGLGGEVRYNVTKSTGESFEETLTTSATSNIVVSRHSRCTATVILQEHHLLARFQVRVVMSMPEGEALVFIKNKEGKTVFVKQILNLSLLFPAENHIDLDQGGVRADAVKFEVKGIVEGTQLSTHRIRLKSSKLQETGVKQLTGAGQEVLDSDDDEEEDSTDEGSLEKARR